MTACNRCGAPDARHRWGVCAIRPQIFHGMGVPLCDKCDIAANDLMLHFLNHPDRKRLMTRYRAQVRRDTARAKKHAESLKARTPERYGTLLEVRG